MNKLLLALLIWLSACATTAPSYVALPAQPYYFAISAPLYTRPGHGQVGLVAAGTPCTVVGQLQGWYVVQAPNSRLYYVSDLRLSSGTAPASYDAPVDAVHDTYTGPRGGQYYYNGNGNKTYVTPQSTIQNNTIYTGPRGGSYYINRNGNKTYIKR